MVNKLGDYTSRELALRCFTESIQTKRDYLVSLKSNDYAYSRIKSSINVDLRKLHDFGPHLLSKSVLDLASSRGVRVDFSTFKNGTNSKQILGEDYPLQLEHVFPVAQTVSLILSTPLGVPLYSLIHETSYTAWILEEEDERIEEISFRKSPRLSYLNAEIELLNKVDEKWIQFDWSNIEEWAAKSVR